MLGSHHLSARLKLLLLFTVLTGATIQPGQQGTIQPGQQGTVQPGQQQGGTIQPGQQGAVQPGQQGGSGTVQPGQSAQQGAQQPLQRETGSDPDSDSVKTLPGTYSGYAANNAAVCPDADLKAYETEDGYFYVVQCSRKRLSSTPIQTVTATSLQNCIDKCGAEPTCNSVNYRIDNRDCILQTESDVANQSADVAQTHHYAVKIDPPTQKSPNKVVERCATKCPDADGQVYEAIYGQSFIMHCGRRHATPYIKINQQVNLTSCIDSCAASTGCTSVDFHDASGKCYHSSHLGQPMTVTSTFSSAYTLGCTGACSGRCGGCCGTGEKRLPPKPIEPLLPDLSCGNQGLQWALYDNKVPDGSNLAWAANNPGFFPERFQKARLTTTGITKSLGISDYASKGVYGSRPNNPEYMVINHKGYVCAQTAGVYTFNFPACDDTGVLWVGPGAYKGYTRANANALRFWGDVSPRTVTYTATAGEYIPVRIMVANTGGIGSFSFTITGPDGKVIIDDKTQSCPFIVQYSCDKTTAPRFAAFGAES